MTETNAARLRGWWAPAVAGGIAFVVYLRTLLPGMAFADWGEMQTVPHVLGVAHPTGYPTYVVLSWLAQLVPIGSVAFRSNLLSAVLVAVAVGVTVAILGRLKVGPIVAIGAALVLAGTRTVWSTATVAEVNPLHLALVALLLHRALVWEERRAMRDLAIGGLLLGLALGNHLLTVFAAPCLVLFVLWVGRRAIRARPWILTAGAAAGLLGLSIYLYIPIAAAQEPPLPYNHPVTFDGVWWLVSGTQFRTQFDFLTPDGPSNFVASMPALWSLVIGQATPVVPVLGLAGLVVLLRRRTAFGLLCAAIMLTHLYVWSTYLHLEHYLPVAWLILSIGLAVALDVIARALASRGPRIGRGWRHAAAAMGAAGIALALWIGSSNWPAMDRSSDRSAEMYVDTILETLPIGAAILTEWDASTPLWHATLVLGRRPDLLVVDDTNIVYDGWVTRERRIASLICERPVFILRLDDEDLLPTRAAYRLEPIVTVAIAQGGPSAAVRRSVFRVEPLDPASCGT